MEAGDAEQPVLAFPHHLHGVLEQLRQGRLRSRRRLWSCRGRTGRTTGGRGRVPCRPSGRPPRCSPARPTMNGTRPAMIADSTDPFPAPVAPTHEDVGADQLEPEHRAVLSQGDRDTGGQRVLRRLERPHHRFERVVDQEPQLDQMPPLPDRPDPAVQRPERLREPVRDLRRSPRPADRAASAPAPDPPSGSTAPEQRRARSRCGAVRPAGRRCPSRSPTAAGTPSRPATTSAPAAAPDRQAAYPTSSGRAAAVMGVAATAVAARLATAEGDALTNGQDPGLRSPLADQLAIAACLRTGLPARLVIAAPGVDGEIDPVALRHRLKDLHSQRLPTLTGEQLDPVRRVFRVAPLRSLRTSSRRRRRTPRLRPGARRRRSDRAHRRHRQPLQPRC